MQQFIFTIEYVKLNLPFRQFLTLSTMEEIIYRNYFTHSNNLYRYLIVIKYLTAKNNRPHATVNV